MSLREPLKPARSEPASNVHAPLAVSDACLATFSLRFTPQLRHTAPPALPTTCRAALRGRRRATVHDSAVQIDELRRAFLWHEDEDGVHNLEAGAALGGEVVTYVVDPELVHGAAEQGVHELDALVHRPLYMYMYLLRVV